MPTEQNDQAAPFTLTSPPATREMTMEEKEAAATRGALIRITRFTGEAARDIANGDPDTMRWLAVSGYIDTRVHARTGSYIHILGGAFSMSLSDVEFHVIPPLEPGSLVVFRQYREHGRRLISRQGDCGWFSRGAVMRVVQYGREIGLGHPLRATVAVTCALGEVRLLSQEESDYVAKELAIPEMGREEILELLGPSLRDMIRQYPMASVTRGMVFARTETALSEEDKDFDTIVARLGKSPGLLAASRGEPEAITIPPAMLMRCQKATDDALGLIKPQPVVSNPLTALDDGDLVTVHVRASENMVRCMRQVCSVTCGGTMRIPARYLKQGARAVREWLSANPSVMPEFSDPEWEDEELLDQHTERIEIESVNFGEMGPFIIDDDNGDGIDIPI